MYISVYTVPAVHMCIWQDIQYPHPACEYMRVYTVPSNNPSSTIKLSYHSRSLNGCFPVFFIFIGTHDPQTPSHNLQRELLKPIVNKWSWLFQRRSQSRSQFRHACWKKFNFLSRYTCIKLWRTETSVNGRVAIEFPLAKPPAF